MAFAIPLLLILALVLRIRSAVGDLWLDEIWSLTLATTIHSPLQIWTAIHHDNNHHINTLFLFLLGNQSQSILYRLPSCLAGVATVWVAATLTGARSRAEKITIALVYGLSYWMIHYSSEARGYSYLTLFSLLAYASARYFLEDGSWRSLASFALVTIFGISSHISFLHTLLGVGVWVTWEKFQRSCNYWKTTRDLLLFFSPSVLFVLLVWFFDTRHLRFGGGDRPPNLQVALETIGWGVGGSISPFVIALSILSIGFMVRSVWVDNGNRGRDGIFFLMSIVIFPLLFLLRDSRYLYPRYFTVSVGFLLLLLARYLARAFTTRNWERSVAIVLVIGLIVSNGTAILDLWRWGRGNYRVALETVIQEEPSNQVTIGSNHDFRNRTVIEYYVNSLQSSKGLEYRKLTDWSSADPKWFVMQRHDSKAPPNSVIEPQGVRFVLKKFYPSAGLSGWGWAIYHRG